MLATYHLLVMVIATALFAAAWAARRRGYIGGDVTTLGLILGVAAFALLILGSTLEGAGRRLWRARRRQGRRDRRRADPRPS
jgi:hypothetical protein